MLIILFAIITAISVWLTTYLFIEKEKRNKSFIKKLNAASRDKIILWVVDRYKDEDIEKLRSNRWHLEIILKYLVYIIAINTDRLRNLHDWVSSEEKAWYINALHDLHTFFYKLTKPKKENEKYTWQNLM